MVRQIWTPVMYIGYGDGCVPVYEPYTNITPDIGQVHAEYGLVNIDFGQIDMNHVKVDMYLGHVDMKLVPCWYGH